MSDWLQILAVIAIAAGAVWLWHRTRRSPNCSQTTCQNCPLADRCQKK